MFASYSSPPSCALDLYSHRMQSWSVRGTQENLHGDSVKVLACSSPLSVPCTGRLGAIPCFTGGIVGWRADTGVAIWCVASGVKKP